jgi:hypothetical protein
MSIEPYIEIVGNVGVGTPRLVYLEDASKAYFHNWDVFSYKGVSCVLGLKRDKETVKLYRGTSPAEYENDVMFSGTPTEFINLYESGEITVVDTKDHYLR